MKWPHWMPRPLALAVWVATRAVLLSLVGSFHPWNWFPDLLYRTVGVMLDGGNPYAGLQVYPPLAIFAFLVPRALAPSPEAFRIVYPLFIVAIDLAILFWMRRAERDGFARAGLAYAVALPAIGPILLLSRFDLLPMLCQIAATICAVRGARAWSWAWLGIGIALKLYLLALVPLWIAWEFYSHRRAAPIARGLALALGPVVVFAAVALAAWGPRSIDPYTYSFHRGITIDSTAATVIAELDRAGFTGATWSSEVDCDCPVRSGGPSVDRLLRNVSSAIGVAGALGFALWYLRRPSTHRFVAGAAGITAVAAFASPILSPQHLVWPLAPLALVAFDPRGRIALRLAMVAAATAAFLMLGPAFQVHVLEYTDLGRALLLTRAVAELGAVLVLVFPTGLELGRSVRSEQADPRRQI